jgi:hypothetical protein
MKRESWQDRDGHPPADLLLLHLEDELEGRAADAVRLHLNQCAACRHECDQLERGMSNFMAFRDSVVLPTPAPRTTALHERLLRTEAEGSAIATIKRIGGLFRLNSPPRLAFVLGSAFLCMVVWLWIFLGTPRESVYASQILDNARNASDSLMAHAKVLNQKIRLRRGNLVIERSVHHGRQTPLQAQESRVDPQLQQDLDLAHINMNDPLNSNDFADWRTGQRGHIDSIKETLLDVTITTRVVGGAIAAGSLTLSRAGWRPIARSVEFRGEAPIEISELGYDISDSTSAMREPAIGSLAPGAAATISAPAARAEVSAAELEASELDLREALHSIGADVSAAPEIWRSEDTVLFRAFPQSARQKEAIGGAASRIPHVKEADKQSARLSATPLAQVPAPYTTAPPLAADLESKLGDAQAARSFLDSLSSRSSHVVAEAAALDQLGKRYTVDAVKALPPDLRVRVNRLAASMLSSLQHDSADYVKALSPTLDEMAHDLNVTAPAEDSKNLPGCLTWQENAALAAPQLRNLENNVSLLFVPTQTEKPIVPAADKLIADSLKARSFLELHLMSTCQLFGAN